MNVEEAALLIDQLFAVYPNAPTKGRRRREIVDAWAPHLEVVDYADGIAAAEWLVKSSRFLPSLAELLEAARMCRRDRLGTVSIPDPLLDQPEPEGGYMTLTEWKRQRKATG